MGGQKIGTAGQGSVTGRCTLTRQAVRELRCEACTATVVCTTWVKGVGVKAKGRDPLTKGISNEQKYFKGKKLGTHEPWTPRGGSGTQGWGFHFLNDVLHLDLVSDF